MLKSSTTSAFSPIRFFGVPAALTHQITRHPHPKQFTLALTTFANLGLLHSEHAAHNLGVISRFARLWFSEDERADTKRLFQQLTPEVFDQTRFDYLINATRTYQREEPTSHGVRLRLCQSLSEMLNNPFYPVATINLPNEISLQGLGYPEPPTNQTNWPPKMGR